MTRAALGALIVALALAAGCDLKDPYDCANPCYGEPVLDGGDDAGDGGAADASQDASPPDLTSLDAARD